MSFIITHYGTATTLIGYGPFTFLTDPVLDPGPGTYVRGPVELRRTVGPAATADSLPPVDAVLVSHDEHPDNLDDQGRAFLEGRPVFTTVSGAERLGGQSQGLAPWETREFSNGEHTVRITGTPCQHGPFGEVTGFVLEATGEETVYISGDTIYFPDLDMIGRRFDIDIAVLHMGAAKVPVFAGDDLISMDGVQAATLTKALDPRVVVPVHYESWEHFTEDRPAVQQAFKSAGVESALRWLQRGVPTLV